MGILVSQDPGRELVTEALDYYGTMESFSAVLDHKDSSGLFAGEYTQTLSFRAPDVFELKVTKSGARPKDAYPVPDYYAKGGRVWKLSKEGRTSDSFHHDPNIGPGWEVSGGMAMLLLAKTSSTSFFLNPQDGLTVTYGVPQATTWRNEKVRKVEMTASFQGQDQKLLMYFTRDDPIIVGQQWEPRPGLVGHLHYTARKINPDLPATLGTPPPATR